MLIPGALITKYEISREQNGNHLSQTILRRKGTIKIGCVLQNFLAIYHVSLLPRKLEFLATQLIYSTNKKTCRPISDNYLDRIKYLKDFSAMWFRRKFNIADLPLCKIKRFSTVQQLWIWIDWADILYRCILDLMVRVWNDCIANKSRAWQASLWDDDVNRKHRYRSLRLSIIWTYFEIKVFRKAHYLFLV